ncbi:hypothetical protein TanjilG_04699 [Lupinus angustifolius]|uniref:Uncharacterized protein n=1 Tax=Lupinus angustifolius TaxID=3871 RepID=A0A4P1RJT7_LUPAN|nr:hypothetical protein TanjilG_04699 [Lupinus angustifolius]
MSLKCETTTFLQPSTSDHNHKGSKTSYTIQFLLSLSKVDTILKLPTEFHLSVSCSAFQDESGLLSSPSFCAPDSRCYKFVPQNSHVKVPDDVNHLLHRSDEPYLPPCRYKALPPSSRDSNNVVNCTISGSSECRNQEKTEQEMWRKDTVRQPTEDKWHSSENTDSKECQEVLSMSSLAGNLKSLQSTSNSFTEQSDASTKLNMIQEAVTGDALQPTILPETTKNCATKCQPVQDLLTNESVNLWQKSVHHIDTSWHFLSVLDDGMHLMESEAYSNFDVEHPEGTSHVIESLNKSSPSSILSQESCRNTKNSHCEVSYEKDIMELQLSELSTISACDGYPGRSTIDGDISEASILFPIEDGKHLQGVKHATSVNMKQNPSSPGFQIQQDFELNSSSSNLNGKPYSSSELCLPDGDSLIAFDEPFLMADEPFDKALSSPARNPIEPDAFSPSSPGDMIVKLIESILKDDSPPPHLDDPKVNHVAGIEDFGHSLCAQKSRTQLHSNQFNPRGHHSFQLNNIDPAGFSFFSYHSFITNTMSQPFQMASCSSKLNATLNSTSGYHQSSYADFIRPKLDSCGESNIKQAAVVDSLADMKLRAGGFE